MKADEQANGQLLWTARMLGGAGKGKSRKGGSHRDRAWQRRVLPPPSIFAVWGKH